MSSFRALIAISICALFVSAATRPKEPKKTADLSNSTVRKWMRGMSLHDKVAQLVIMPVYGEVTNTRSAASRKYQHFVRDLHVGGVIVTGHIINGSVRNAEPFAMAALLNRLQKTSKIPLLVSADFERGT